MTAKRWTPGTTVKKPKQQGQRGDRPFTFRGRPIRGAVRTFDVRERASGAEVESRMDELPYASNH